MARFEGKTVIVTGGGSGIGRATSRLFAAEGAHVFAADITDAASETAAMIRSDGGKAEGVKMNAAEPADVKALVDRALAATGRLDVFYANAGVSGGFAGIFEQTADDWRHILNVNLIGPFLAIQAAAPEMAKRGGGAIICTASVAGIRSGAGGPAYSASKAGVINLVTVAAQQLAGTNVRVNAICPGIIETGMTKPIFDRAAERGTTDKIGQLNPLRRYGVPEEIGRVALFLASDEASYVNGHAVVVDGGLTSSMPVVPPKK
ncbi:glucose 1-dehydrogenase [bacterium]|nr:glucose 1-dehydrogenase [bacterium]